MKRSSIDSVLHIAKALGDRQRIRVLLLLRGRELCVCQIISVLGLAPSTISKHLSVLGSAGLVTHRKEGRWAYYRLTGGSGGSDVRAAIRWVEASLLGDEETAKDADKLARVLRSDPELLCRRQRRNRGRHRVERAPALHGPCVL